MEASRAPFLPHIPTTAPRGTRSQCAPRRRSQLLHGGAEKGIQPPNPQPLPQKAADSAYRDGGVSSGMEALRKAKRGLRECLPWALASDCMMG
eukprot:933434-Pelagomonas_calceolata.AAC.19